jgi:hypothetical protein
MYHKYIRCEEIGRESGVVVLVWGRELREIAVSDASEFSADYIGREAGAEQHAIERGDLFFVEGASEVRKATLEAVADERGLVGISEDGGERCVDVLIGNATASKLACDAETALATGLRMMTGVFEGVASIVEIVQFPQTGDHGRDEVFFFGAAFEVLLHFVNRKRAAHKSPLGGHIELVLCAKLADALHSHG